MSARRVEIVTPPAATRLATATAVRNALCLDTALADAVIEALIDRVSAAIARRIGAGDTLGRRTVLETQIAPPMSANVVSPLTLSNRPVALVVSVQEDGAALDTADWFLAGGGCIWRRDGRATRNWTATEIIVEYQAGYLLPGEAGRDLPPDLEMACIRWVDAALAADRESERPRVSKESLAGVGSWEFDVVKRHGADGMPPDAAALLAPYIRRHV
jgi:hypothetical protein